MSIKWKRIKNISKQHYNSLFQEEKYEVSQDATKKSKLEKAYETALKTRELEINLYWERTKYFWAFITTIYVAYFNVLVQLYDKKHGSFPLVLLSLLGFLFSVLWLFTSKASKHWQQNWENHIDLLEDKITGPLFKIYEANISFSVTKINIVMGWIVSTLAGGLFVFELVEFCRNLFYISKIFIFIFSVLATLIGLIALYFTVIGNADSFGEIHFDRKIYDGESL